MTWKIEVESITPDKTRMFLRELDGEGYWEVETQTEPHRAWHTVRFNGWHVMDVRVREYIEGVEVRYGRASMVIPPEVLSHIPPENHL